MPELRDFQRAFVRSLLAAQPIEGVPELGSFGAALTVHRNTVIKALVDALEANYPTVAQLVGPEWFRACAVEYVRLYPARSAALVLYGDSFPSFLSTFAPAQELPYLCEVARIDRMWIEAHTARDATPLPAASFAHASPSTLYEQRVALHPATRFGWFRHSAATIWMHHRSGRIGAELDIADGDEGLLLARTLETIRYLPLDPAGFKFLDRLRAGDALGEAASAALAIHVDADVASQFAQFVTAGVFVGSPRGCS